MDKKRSVGVTLIGIIFITVGGFLIYSANFIDPILMLILKKPLIIARIVKGVVILLMGLCLFSLKPWTRKLAIYLIPLFLFIWVFSYMQFSLMERMALSQDTGLTNFKLNNQEQVGIIFNVLTNIKYITLTTCISIAATLIFVSPIIFYLTRPKVKRQFVNEEGAESRTK